MGLMGTRGLMAMLILGLLPTPAARSAAAQLSFESSRRRPLFASRHPLLSEAHIGVGGSAAFTPAHARGGVWLEAAPMSVFVLRVGAEPAYYFGSFDSLTSFESRNDPFDTDSRRARQSAQSGTATRFYVTPRLQARAGRLIGVASADFEWWSSNAAGPFFYELPSLKASADHSASARLPQIPVQRVKPACAARNASSNRVTTSGQHRPGTTEVALQPIPTASLRTILPWVDDLYVHGGIAFGEGAVEGDEREIARLGERGQVVVGPELVIVVVSG